MRFFLLICKNLWRNKVRSLLTALAVVALVAIFSLIVNVLLFLDGLMTEKNKDVKVIITERHRLLSSFDRSHMDRIVAPWSELSQELRQVPGFRPEQHTLWHFVGFTLDPTMKDKDKAFFVIATLPDKIATMTDGLNPEDFDPRLVELVRKPPRSGLDNAGMVMGALRLEKLNKQVGDVFKATSITHRDGSGLRQPIEMEFEIVGALPMESRWNDLALIDYAYLDRVLKAKKNEFDGKITYGWLQLDDQPSAHDAGGRIERSIRDIKVETAASAYGRFMEPLKNILWGIKYVLIPAIVVVMTLILANTFSITVRERQREMAVLKVLGFGAGRILVLVLGEALLAGVLGGVLGAVLTYGLVNHAAGGIRLTGFPVLRMSLAIFWWGPVLGVLTALVGGLVPAWSARAVKVSNVFASVA
jgi:putative ABC transport system permease protein